MTLDSTLEQGLTELGLHADADVRQQLLAYVNLLDKWNRVYNLTAVRDVREMITQHVLDSLAVLPHLAGATVVDVGSGGGLPGLPIAIAGPHIQVALLDSNQKKAAFLRQAVIELALKNVTVVCERSESWRPAQRFDVVISRAFADLAQFVAAAGHLCAHDGVMIAMKGTYPDEELATLSSSYRVLGVKRLRVPGLNADRHIALLQPAAAVEAST
jgi:16S rRNA (guanine527-N7)-methyltransferase